MTIKKVNSGNVTDADRIELAKLLIKFGYKVQIKTIKTDSKTEKVVEVEE